MQTQSPPPVYMPLHPAQNGAAAVGQGHGGVSHNPAYQELQFSGPQSSHYQALTTSTRETPPEPTTRTASTSSQEEPVPSGSQYMPISPVSCVGRCFFRVRYFENAGPHILPVHVVCTHPPMSLHSVR